jgi:hypothetical protein
VANLKRAAALAAGAFLTLGCLTPAAPAQPPAKPDDTIRMPAPKKADENPPTLWGYLAVFIILAAVFGANMIPSKRGHQD